MELEHIRNALKALPTREALFLIQNYNHKLEEELQKKNELSRVYEISSDSDISTKKREYVSLQNLINENEKHVQDEYNLWELDHKTNNEWLERVDACCKERLSETVAYQNRMNELRNQLFSTISYNEEELTAEIKELEDKTVAIISEIEQQNGLLSTIKGEVTINVETEASIDAMECVIQSLKTDSRQFKEDIKALESKIHRMDEEMRECK